jgi:uncharacterized protein
MNTYSTTSSIVPTSTTERIIDIDILRGFALFGILVVNILYFCAPDAFYTYYFEKFPSLLNDGIFHAVNFLFSGRFYPVFSFLFGLGFFIQFSKLKQKGVEARGFFIRRLSILLLFGVMHILFVWEEDILLFYALFGFVLIYLADKTPKLVLIAAILTYILPVCFAALNAAFHFAPPKYSPFDTLESYILFYTTASYWQILQVRLALYADKLFTIGGFIHHFDRLAFFLFGLYAGKAGLMTNLSVRISRWARLWVAAFIFGIIGQALWITVSATKGLSQLPISMVMTGFFILAQVFTYIVGVLLVLKIANLKKIFGVFAFPGRMALTNYLMGTTTFSLLFNSYGLGLYGHLGPAQLMGIAILFFAFQVIVSNIWLRYCSYGPLEWLWRCATYRKIFPLLRPVTETPQSAFLASTE